MINKILINIEKQTLRIKKVTTMNNVNNYVLREGKMANVNNYLGKVKMTNVNNYLEKVKMTNVNNYLEK